MAASDNPDELISLLSDASERAQAYAAGIGDRHVGATPEAIAALVGFDEALPQTGASNADTINMLDRLGSPATMATTGGRYFGFVNGGTHPAALAAAWLSATWDQNNALSVMSPIGAKLDAIAIDWVVDALGLPPSTGGAFVTGATMANATALATARDHVLAQAGWDSHTDGLVGAPPITVYAGEAAHSTIGKALGFIGMGRRRFRKLPADKMGRITPENLPELDGPTIVILQAGNVNGGASDPFGPLNEWAHEAGAWVHVDGAFGLWSAASPTRRHLGKGVEQADSWATDAHKWLNVTYDCGIVLVADPTRLQKSMESSAPYLTANAAASGAAALREPMHMGPSSSQRARGVEVWATLRTLGRDGLADLIDRTSDHAKLFADLLADAGIRILNDVEINQVVVDLGPETKQLIDKICDDGTCWVGSTEWAGRPAMRISVSCWATTEQDIRDSAAAMIAVIDKEKSA